MVDASGDERAAREGSARGKSTATGSFGPNAWLVDDMYDRFRVDPTSVSESWREFFVDYSPTPVPTSNALPARPAAVTPAPEAVSTATPAMTSPPPVAAPAPPARVAAPSADEDPVSPLRGAASRIVINMEASLGVPTATSVRAVPAKLLEVNRQALNEQLARTTGAKVSFTHLIGYAVVRALVEVPALNAHFVASIDEKGTPGVVRHAHVGLGLAVDVEKSDGSRNLVVPCIKQADTLDFRSFVLAYEELVRKVHSNKSGPRRLRRHHGRR